MQDYSLSSLSVEIPAARSTKYRVILILGVLLILAFLVVVILVSLLFIDYKSTQKEILQMKNDSALKKGISDLQKSVANMTDDLNKIKLIKNKGPSYPLCSEGWNHYGLSCYYFSSDKKPWIASKKECEDKEAHLVVINSEEEMKFLRGFANKQTFWIGLTDADGTWKWVDGTPYDITPKFWGNTQPDDWKGHGLGGGEDCATLSDGYDWNDLQCSSKIKYICEKKMTF
ncbi:C-type lectin domain family 10 member A-like [Aquarana catesbeiana]|uniref:C-type lectin domain family 10 member A-like n=1 Tax=Aquarana catesbeiana TaxID=8400 RepID=UPI003CCA5022